MLAVLMLWGWADWWLAGRLCSAIDRPHVRAVARCMVFALLLPLPVADEMYSLPAFTSLCRAHADVVVEAPALAGRSVWFVGVVSKPRQIGLLKGLERRWNYEIPEAGAPAFHHTDFEVEGGRFIQMLHISQTPSPLLFEGRCASKQVPDLRSRLQVTVTDKPR